MKISSHLPQTKHTNHLPRFAPWVFQKILSWTNSTRTILGPSWCGWVSFVHLSLWQPLPALFDLIRRSHIIGRFLGEEGFGNELSWDSVMTFFLFGWVRRFSLKRGFDRFWTGNDSGNLGVRKVWFSKSLQDDFHPSKSEKKI